MLVKIGNQVFDPNDVPILLYLSDQDKENIKNMPDGKNIIGHFPKWGTSRLDVDKICQDFKEEVGQIKRGINNVNRTGI